jgi:prolyl oligopeptidase
MTQRPELMKVALPAVGVMDMLRYHTFTSGAGWAYDYGTAQDSQAMFKYIKAILRYTMSKRARNIQRLVTTGDHDDRVVPAHSFKFAAELQENKGNNPTLTYRCQSRSRSWKISFGYHSGKRGYSSLHTVQYGI